MKKAGMGMAMEPSDNEKRRLKKSRKGMEKGYKPISGPSFKTGGMVNSNTKVSASKVAKGKVGGTSKAPKKAVPTKK